MAGSSVCGSVRWSSRTAASCSGLATSEDVSGDRARESRLRQIHGLTPFGSCQFDLRSGWDFDRELLELWGVDAATDPLPSSTIWCCQRIVR